MNEKVFDFGISKERKKQLEDLTNKPVEGVKYNPLHISQPYMKDAYEGKVNQEELKAKRLECIDRAILEVMSRYKSAIEGRKASIKEGTLDKNSARENLYLQVGLEIANELEKQSGIKISDKPVDLLETERHWQEFSRNVVEKRFYEWDFLSEDEMLKPADAKIESK